MEHHFARALGATDLDRALYLDLKLAIGDNDLYKVNRMTERARVAVRYPFLDAGLAEAAARVPASLKMRGRKLRVFFKRAYRDLLPSEVVAKTKHGFGLPIAVWLRTDPTLNAMMQELVLGPQSLARGYFQKPALERLIEEASHGYDPVQRDRALESDGAGALGTGHGSERAPCERFSPDGGHPPVPPGRPVQPVLGILAYVWVGLMNPHRFVYRLSNFPVALAFALATMAA